MTTLLVSLADRVGRAISRMLPEPAEDLIAAPNVSEGLALAGARSIGVALVGGSSIASVIASCRQLRAAGICRDSVIVPAVRDDDRDVQDVLAAGADDVFLDSLADGLLRNRLLVAQRLVAQRASAKGTSLCVHGAEFERFFDLCRDLLAIAGFDGHFKKVNQAWTRTLGWTTAELLAEPSLNFVHPDDRDKTLEARSQLASRKPLGSFTNRYRSRDGSYRWLEWQIAPSGDGALVHAAARDVTDAQIVKDLTRELTESLATTLDSLGDGVIATDVEGRLRT